MAGCKLRRNEEKMIRKMQTMDGNQAAAHVAYAFTEVAVIYPITPSSPMADYTDSQMAAGRQNIFGSPVSVAQMQSEAGVAGAFHGSLQAGALTTTFTASQGLLLMVPNMYKVAGELLPGVIHVAARAIASHALSIFGDHQDIYGARQTGFAFLASCNVQEVMDLGAVAHLSAIKGRIPFVHFFDGFRTSHEIKKIAVWDYEELAQMCDMEAVKEFRNRALNPNHPVLRGTAQNPDVFFQAREACNPYYERLPEIVQEYMDKVNEKTGENYQFYNYYGVADATHIIVAMGSVCDTVEETIDYLSTKGEKVGLVKVRLYRPFVREKFLEAIPSTVEKISVLDRTKEPGAMGEPLYLDVVAAIKDTEREVPVASGRYGLGSKDTTPADIAAVFHNTEKKVFTLGIKDDVTGLSLERKALPDITGEGTTSCKFWGLGSDGTVGANKNSIKIIGDYTDKYVQAYFDYDSKKSGGITISHLRFGDKPVKAPYLVEQADFVACHNPAYIREYAMVQDLKDGGSFLLNCPWTEKELEEKLPGQVKKYLHDHKIKFYIIDGYALGKKVGLGGRINTILQSAFFAITGIIPPEDAIRLLKEKAAAAYQKKGDEVVQMNLQAIELGAKEYRLVKIPEEWSQVKEEPLEKPVKNGRREIVEYVNNIQKPVNKRRGDELPVSAFLPYADGTMPSGSAAYEKRGIAPEVPEWIKENCIQCNFCSYVCPHSVIRPVVSKASDQNIPENYRMDMTQMPEMKFTVSISVMDCTGCGTCVKVCPGKMSEGQERKKALQMKPLEAQLESQKIYNIGQEMEVPREVFTHFPKNTIKGSQFVKPLFEFSGACAGCGETPYAKLVTQLFGERALIANATGCSSIWGGSCPASPYTINSEGRGPAWANSLFEDNAEYGFGMALAGETLRSRLVAWVKEIMDKKISPELTEKCEKYLKTYSKAEENFPAANELVQALSQCQEDSLAKQKLLEYKDYLSKKSYWIFGGDGWAYDIGYGGLDHVLAMGSDVNILVFDTEVYSNTGGQASKATPTGAIAQFAARGKDMKKKDLAAMAMNYGYVYVAQIAMGANMKQCIDAITEAESYEGPSLVIAYSPCINHGIKTGMKDTPEEEKKAVEAGYWHLFRYDPRKRANGQNPFTLDSGEPKGDYQQFLMGEVRYEHLQRIMPDRANQLFKKAEKEAKEKYETLLHKSGRGN